MSQVPRGRRREESHSIDTMASSMPAWLQLPLGGFQNNTGAAYYLHDTYTWCKLKAISNNHHITAQSSQWLQRPVLHHDALDHTDGAHPSRSLTCPPEGLTRRTAAVHCSVSGQAQGSSWFVSGLTLQQHLDSLQHDLKTHKIKRLVKLNLKTIFFGNKFPFTISNILSGLPEKFKYDTINIEMKHLKNEVSKT